MNATFFKDSKFYFLLGLVILCFYAGYSYAGTKKTIVLHESTETEIDSLDFLHIDVSGNVLRPGVYTLKKGSLITDAIKAAGGFSVEADKDYISKKLNLAMYVEDSQKIYIPSYEDTQISSAKDTTNPSAPSIPSMSSDEEVEVETDLPLVHVNKATKDDLMVLKGIGPSYADRIIQNRPYSDFEDLVARSKVPKATLEKLKNSLSF